MGGLRFTLYDYGERGSGAKLTLEKAFKMYGVSYPANLELENVEADSALSDAILEKLAAHPCVLVNLFPWADVVLRLKQAFPEKRVVYFVHSVLRYERVANPYYLWGEAFGVDIEKQERLIDLADVLIFPSSSDREYSKRLYPLESKKTEVIYPLPVVPVFDAENYDAEQKQKADVAQWLYIGRGDLRKGLESVIESYFQYYCRRSALAHLNFVSDLEDAHHQLAALLRDELKLKLDFLVSRKALSFSSWKDDRRAYIDFVRRLVQQNAMLLAPSYYDPFNIVIYECLLLGMPAVISRLAGVAELLKPEGSFRFRLVNPYSAKEIVRAMEELSDPVVPHASGSLSFDVTPKGSYEALAKALGVSK
jgi:glycosyltransferase involved in cell wall biosynthesis